MGFEEGARSLPPASPHTCALRRRCELTQEIRWIDGPHSRAGEIADVSRDDERGVRRLRDGRHHRVFEIIEGQLPRHSPVRSLEIANLKTNLQITPQLDASGQLTFSFGGDLNVNGDMSGKFRGRIAITAQYE